MGWIAGRVGCRPARCAVPAELYAAVAGNSQAEPLVKGAGRDEAAPADRNVQGQEGGVDKNLAATLAHFETFEKDEE